MNDSTFWGKELPSVEPDRSRAAGDDAAALIQAGRWDDALASLARTRTDNPLHGTSALELASAVHLAKHDDPRGAVARLHFSLGHPTLPDPQGALARHLGERLDTLGDAEWAALAWSLHRDGEAAIAELCANQRLDERWLSTNGYEQLEALVFERADDTDDRGWHALSALIASRDARATFDENTILSAAIPSDPSIPRAWGVQLQVLLALDRNAEVETTVALAVSRFGEDPAALLELLDAAAADSELPELLGRLRELEPDWASTRERITSQDTRTAEQPRARLGDAFDALDLLAERPRLLTAAEILLPEPPRRTDDEWLERKARGDAAMKAWLQRWMFIAVLVVTAVVVLLPLV